MLRLARDVWKLGLRTGLRWTATQRLAWVPRTRGNLTPSHHPAFPRCSQPLLLLATGNRMAPSLPWGPLCPWSPGVIVPKFSFPVPSVRKP